MDWVLIPLVPLLILTDQQFEKSSVIFTANYKTIGRDKKMNSVAFSFFF